MTTQQNERHYATMTTRQTSNDGIELVKSEDARAAPLEAVLSLCVVGLFVVYLFIFLFLYLLFYLFDCRTYERNTSQYQ